MEPVLHVGCAMWAHRSWVGRFLPLATPAGGELEAYAKVVDAVEGNTTFYAVPTPATASRWAAQVGDGFRFVCKVPRTITHELRLRGIDAELGAFLAAIEPLRAHVGSLTFQLPPSFAPVDLPVLDAALAHAPRDWPWSVELRHPGFFDAPGVAAVEEVLHRHGAERVLLDSRPLFSQPPRTDAGREAWEAKPRVPALASACTDAPVVRFIGSDDDEVTTRGLAEWEPILAAWLEEGRRPTFFVHTPDNVDAPRFARELHERMCALVPALRPLPDAPPVQAGEQPTLF